MPGLTELALRGQMPGVSLRPNRKRRPTWTNRVKISRCYRDALVGDPNLSGVVKVKVHTDHYAGVFRTSAPSRHRSTGRSSEYDVTLRP
jgi:hypothetical protein